MKTTCLLAFLLTLLSHGAPVQNATAGSPDLESVSRHIRVSLTIPPAGDGQVPHWSASFRGEPILKSCRLGLQTAADGELLADARLADHQRRSVDEEVQVLFGKTARARDRFNESRFKFLGRAGVPVEVVFRCYDDAIAVRYEVGGVAGAPVVVTEESTSFGVEQNPTAYVQYLEHFKTSHEHEVAVVPVHEVRPEVLLDMPLTLAWGDRVYAAITEASLRRYAGMSLSRSAAPGAGQQLVCRLTPRADGSKVATVLPLKTPWRVVLLGERAGSLLESSTLYCLNDPSVIGDSSWIRPGKITFHWWNGDVYDGAPGLPMLSVEMARKYIDFCARHGLPIHSITSTEGITTPWYVQSRAGVEPGPDTDVTRPRPGFDLETIRAYAASNHIRLWTWVHQGALRGRVEEAYAAFEKLGWCGMMVDFFDHDDQESVELAEAILAAAARHRILVHLHGVWKPTGLERTYPNLMNHEGALNLEYLKWSDRCTPEHTLRMAFTRLVAGPMDYHLGGFRAVPRESFKPQQVAPSVLGTRCHMLALYVCLDNPAPMLADYPTAYARQPGFDFLLEVPTWWDETRILQGRIGERLVTARRKGSAWYLGAIAASPVHELAVPLSFLGPGSFTARTWQDDARAETDPNRLTSGSRRVTAADILRAPLARGGGFVAVLSPAGQ